MKKLKILIICTYHKESAPVFTYGMAKGFLENNIETYAIVSDITTNKNDWLTGFPKNNVVFFHRNMSSKFRKYTSLIKEFSRIIRKFNHDYFDFIILTFPYNNTDYLLTKTVKYNYCIMVFHDVIPHSSTQYRITKKGDDIIKKADFAIVMTKSYIDVMTKKYSFRKQNIIYMRHGMPMYPLVLKENNNMTKDHEIRYDNEKNEHINFLFFGRIEGYKGLHILSAAYGIVIHKHGNVSLTIAGSGDFLEYQDEYNCLPNVTIVNRYIDDCEIPGLFSKDKTVVIVPYIDASQSGVIPMAFYYGVPVIASNSGGLIEQLFDGQVGIIFNSGDVMSLVEAMECFIANKSIYEKEKRKMELFSEKIKWNTITKELGDKLMRISSNGERK